MKFVVSLIAFILVFDCSYSQNITLNELNDERIDSLLDRSLKINRLENGVAGYRVQIHHDQSQSRDDSQKFRAKFANDFPMYKTYLEYKAPYYKIQIGNFITKLEAFRVQREISKKYRGSYIVPTYVQYEALSEQSE